MRARNRSCSARVVEFFKFQLSNWVFSHTRSGETASADFVIPLVGATPSDVISALNLTWDAPMYEELVMVSLDLANPNTRAKSDRCETRRSRSRVSEPLMAARHSSDPTRDSNWKRDRASASS